MKARLGLLALLAFGCGKIVGITDTEVDEPGTGGQSSAGSGGGGLAAGKGGANGGSGAPGAGGTATGGTATGGKAGGAASGGTAGAGGNPTAGTAGLATGGVNTSGAGGTLGGAGATTVAGSAGASAGSGGTQGCPESSSRCTSAGRETCVAGVWGSDPCPLNLPTCENDACRVRGPSMVAVDDYFIDSTEVTVDDYGEFLDAKRDDPSGQPSVCAWNTSYYDDTALDPGNWPMTYVDWCDAHAYCAWADKRLCGRIGGGAIVRSDLFLADASQWFRACGGPSGNDHPRPNAVCNSSDGVEDVAEVATFPDCEGYYDGIFDLEGNVAEWVDSCDGSAGAEDTCSVVGGSIVDDQSYCDQSSDDFTRDHTAVVFGFRCCSG